MTNNLLPPANKVCEGYGFTRVCHSVHRGEYLARYPQAFTPQAGMPSWVGTPPGRYPLGSYNPQAGTPPRQVHPLGRYTPLGRYSPRQVPPNRYTLAGTPLGRYTPWAGSPPATVHAGIQSTSGRYASYWNAFLLNYKNSSNVLNRHFTFQTKKEYTFITECSCHKDGCSVHVWWTSSIPFTL